MLVSLADSPISCSVSVVGLWRRGAMVPGGLGLLEFRGPFQGSECWNATILSGAKQRHRTAAGGFHLSISPGEAARSQVAARPSSGPFLPVAHLGCLCLLPLFPQ